MAERILLVDDEQAIWDSFIKVLGNAVEIDTAASAEEGLEALEKGIPYSVIIADLRLPGMNGIELLAKASEICPDTSRIMISGYADLESTLDAINQGHIFRFVTKPLTFDTIQNIVKAGIRQHTLVTAERELLEKTLSGGVKTLIDILSLVNPQGFSRGSRLRRHVHRIVLKLGLSDLWQFEMAAMLCQIGSIVLTPELLNKVETGAALTNSELEAVESQSRVAHTLLMNIPRLESVAQIIAAIPAPFKRKTQGSNLRAEDPHALGGHILQVAMEFDRLLGQDLSSEQALADLTRRKVTTIPEIVDALREEQTSEDRLPTKAVMVNNLAPEMILDEDVVSKDGLLLAPKGQEVTPALIQRLRSFSNQSGIVEPIRVID